MNKKNKFKNFLLNFILIVLIICNIFAWSLVIYINTSHLLKYKSYSLESVRLTNIECYTQDIFRLKKDIDKLFGEPQYFFNFKQLPKNKFGGTLILFRIINIDENIDIFEFPFVLAHELSHLTKFTANERFCTFNAFKILYESGNEYFKYVALQWLNYDICEMLPQEYSFAGWAEEYLNDFNKN